MSASPSSDVQCVMQHPDYKQDSVLPESAVSFHIWIKQELVLLSHILHTRVSGLLHPPLPPS